MVDLIDNVGFGEEQLEDSTVISASCVVGWSAIPMCKKEYLLSFARGEAPFFRSSWQTSSLLQ